MIPLIIVLSIVSYFICGIITTAISHKHYNCLKEDDGFEYLIATLIIIFWPMAVPYTIFILMGVVAKRIAKQL